MGMLIVRNLPDEVYRALGVRAARHGCSIEAEVQEILSAAVKPQGRVRLGDAMAALMQGVGLTNEEGEAMQRTKDTTPAVAPRLDDSS